MWIYNRGRYVAAPGSFFVRHKEHAREEMMNATAEVKKWGKQQWSGCESGRGKGRAALPKRGGEYANSIRCSCLLHTRTLREAVVVSHEFPSVYSISRTKAEECIHT